MNNFDIKSIQPTGIRLNKYFLTEEIGHGSHGIVYRAYDEKNFNEPVAIKIIEDSGNLDSLLIEPELLSRLNHPNIVSLKDFFIHAGKLVIVTEYLDGIDLQSYLNSQGKLSSSEVTIFLIQMADALAHAHANNIIHRDIKLSNILVVKSVQSIKFTLVDFGISRMTEGIQSVKQIAGTYYYMAPEQLRGRPCEQSDLWSLGICAYNLITGIKPFEGNTQEDIYKKILFSTPQLPIDILETSDPILEASIFHLLEKELINRTVSAKDLLNELQQSSEKHVKNFLGEVKTKNSMISFGVAWEQKIISELKKSWLFFCVFVFLATLPEGIIGEMISLSGVFFFYKGQEKVNTSRTMIGIFTIIIGLLVTAKIDEFIPGNQLNGFSIIQLFLELPFISIAVYFLQKNNQLKENLFFYRILREASSDSEKTINSLKVYIDSNWGDLNLRCKYIEMLFLENRFEEAIVEAKLALNVDPYNFGSSLLLANGYFEVGLYEECMQVCNNYLTISSYSFEFLDLKDRCQSILTDL